MKVEYIDHMGSDNEEARGTLEEVMEGLGNENQE